MKNASGDVRIGPASRPRPHLCADRKNCCVSLMRQPPQFRKAVGHIAPRTSYPCSFFAGWNSRVDVVSAELATRTGRDRAGSRESETGMLERDRDWVRETAVRAFACSEGSTYVRMGMRARKRTLCIFLVSSSSSSSSASFFVNVFYMCGEKTAILSFLLRPSFFFFFASFFSCTFLRLLSSPLILEPQGRGMPTPARL